MDISSIKHHTNGISVIKGTIGDSSRVLILWRDEILHTSQALNDFIRTENLHNHEHDFERIYVNGNNDLISLKSSEANWDVQLIEDAVAEKMFGSTNGYEN